MHGEEVLQLAVRVERHGHWQLELRGPMLHVQPRGGPPCGFHSRPRERGDLHARTASGRGLCILELRPPGCAGVPLRLCEIVRDEDLPLPEVLAFGERRVLRIRGCEGYAERAGLVRTRVRTPEALEPGPGGICWEESGQLLLVIPLRDTNDDNIVRNGSALALFLSSFERVELVCEVRPDGLNLILMAALLGLQPALDLGRELRRKLIEFLIKRCCN